MIHLLLFVHALHAAPSLEIVWSLKLGRERVMLTHLRAPDLDAYRLAYLIGDRPRAAQVIPDTAASAQTRELKQMLPPGVREKLKAPLDQCRSPLTYTSSHVPVEDLCLDRVDRALGERLSRWWLKNRALLGV